MNLLTSPIIIHRSFNGHLNISFYVYDYYAPESGRTANITNKIKDQLLDPSSGGIAVRSHLWKFLASSSFTPSFPREKTTLLTEILAAKSSNTTDKVQNSILPGLSSLTSASSGTSYKLLIISHFLYLILDKIFQSQQLIRLQIFTIPSPLYNAKILCNYMALKIAENPYNPKSVIIEAINCTLY